MATDLIPAVEAAQRLIQMLDGVRVIADAMTRIGSLEQAEREAATRLQVIQAQVDAAQAQALVDITTAQGQVVSAQAGVQAAHAQAAAVLARAADGAHAIVEAAQDEADRLAQIASSTATLMGAAADAAQARLDALEADAAAAVQRKEQAEAVLATALARLGA